jgi:hypothetical protein
MSDAHQMPPPPHAQAHHFVPQSVRVVDLDMPFFSMVTFMVKWAFAAIPAILIITLTIAVAMGILGGMFASGAR